MCKKDFAMKIVIVLLLVFSSLTIKAAEYEFLPISHPELYVEFKGETQAGEGYHKMEILQLGFTAENYFEKIPTNDYYLIYDSGDEYGPKILQRIQGHSPYINKVSENTIEIEYSMAKRHTKQSWKLLGHTAELVKEEIISWDKRHYVTRYDAE
jgi:hypothetical protein